jgi:YesN/AraC family two-component response regulator
VSTNGTNLCRHFSIRQDYIEKFIIESVKEILLKPGMKKRIESHLEELLSSIPEESLNEERVLIERIKDTGSGINNLLSLAEKGVNLESVIKRIKDLETQQDELKNQLETIKQKNGSFTLTPIDRKRVVQIVCSFLENFEKNFDRVSAPEKKELIRQVVEKILVDRKERKARCFIRRFPGLENDQVFGTKAGLVGERVALTGIEPVFPP